jgi:hypothetical protein
VDTSHDVRKTTANIATVVGTGLELLVDTLGNEALTSSVLDLLDTLGGVAGELQHLDLARLKDGLKLSLHLGAEVLGAGDINLVDNHEDKLVGEKRLNALEELDLVGH